MWKNGSRLINSKKHHKQRKTTFDRKALEVTVIQRKLDFCGQGAESVIFKSVAGCKFDITKAGEDP